jgi:hypothetical protein
MYVEIIDGRYAGQMRDIENGVAMDLIRLGRAKHASFDAPAPEAPIVVAEEPSAHIETIDEHVQRPRLHIEAGRKNKSR